MPTCHARMPRPRAMLTCHAHMPSPHAAPASVPRPHAAPTRHAHVPCRHAMPARHAYMLHVYAVPACHARSRRERACAKACVASVSTATQHPGVHACACAHVSGCARACVRACTWHPSPPGVEDLTDTRFLQLCTGLGIDTGARAFASRGLKCVACDLIIDGVEEPGVPRQSPAVTAVHDFPQGGRPRMRDTTDKANGASHVTEVSALNM